jgi:hypothetical protein
MQLGVKHQYFVCAGTLHVDRYPHPEPVVIEDATLSLELWRFPVTLWAGTDDGDATFTTRQGQTYYDRVAELNDVVQISSAIRANTLGMLNTISGSLQISEHGNHYDLECRRAHL